MKCHGSFLNLHWKDGDGYWAGNGLHERTFGDGSEEQLCFRTGDVVFMGQHSDGVGNTLIRPGTA